MATNQLKNLYDQTLRFLSSRPRSEKELRNYLSKKITRLVFRTDPTERILQKLREHNLVNDEDFAVWWCEQRNRFRPRGKKMILSELLRKGINRELALRVIERLVAEEPLIKKLVSKKTNSQRGQLSRSERQRLIAFFLRRGFSWPVVKKVIDSNELKR